LIFVFGDCELDLDRFELCRAGRLRPVEPQVFDLLAVLIRTVLTSYSCGMVRGAVA
jgi:DNA-binding winged helix-turn-helix (wHTH) protein